MAENQLAIINNKERKENFSFHGETVTVHPITVSTHKSITEYVLEEFSLQDDPRVKYLPKLNLYSHVFCIDFLTEVSPINEYEISLYYVKKTFKLIHDKTVNMVKITKLSKCEINFPVLGSESQLYQSYLFCTKICRKDVPYVFLKEPLTLLPCQITDCSLLFGNNALTNFKIVVEDREFLVHKEILAAKSPVFLAMFDSEMKEKKENQMIVEDVDSNVFHEMLRYIYVNTVKELETYAEKLLKAADKYDIPKLKLFCGEELSRSLKVENAIYLLELADKFHESTLKERALKFIRGNIEQILQTENYKTWCKRAPGYLVSDILATIVNFHTKFSDLIC